MNDENVKARIRKLLALAERGVGGEKETANRMLNKMLDRHGMTLWRLTRRAIVRAAAEIGRAMP